MTNFYSCHYRYHRRTLRLINSLLQKERFFLYNETVIHYTIDTYTETFALDVKKLEKNSCSSYLELKVDDVIVRN